MRRPPPLPQPPARPVPEATSETLSRGGVSPSADETFADDAVSATDEHATAPIIPLDAASLGSAARASSVTADGSVYAAPRGSDEVGVSTPDAAISARDVWVAARARRKALRAEVRRFTGRQRRRRAIWLGAAASVVVLVGVTFGVAYSPLFAVERITVVGAQALDATAVESALGGQIGTPLALVDDGDVRASLAEFPFVESYTLEARPPHDLVVRVVERTPVGYLETRAGFTLVDAAGVVLATVPAPGPEAPVMTIEGGTGSPAFEAAGLVIRSLPASIRPQVTAVAATSRDDVRLTLGGSNATVVWGSAEDSAEKALSLEKIMIARPPETVSVYDVSSPNAVIVN